MKERVLIADRIGISSQATCTSSSAAGLPKSSAYPARASYHIIPVWAVCRSVRTATKALSVGESFGKDI